MEFKDLASRYDTWYRTPLGAAAHALESEAIFAMAEVKTGERVLDVGCGTGIYTLELARKGVHVVGMDSSMEMILIARNKFRQAGLKGYFICGSAEALPLQSERFNLALAVTSLCFVRHPDQAIQEVHRILRPGGRLVIGELNRFSLWAFLRWVKGLFKDTIYSQVRFWGRRELERLLRKKGLHPSTVRILLHLPPINLKIYLKHYHFLELVLKEILPGTGAFMVVKAEKGG